MKKATIKDEVHLIENIKTGKRINYVGSLRQKPRGYRVIKRAYMRAMGTESGLC